MDNETGPRAAPAKPLLEAALVFAAFWLTAWLPGDAGAAGAAMAKPAWHLAMILQLVPKALLLLYLMQVEDGLASFGGMDKPRPADLPRAFLTAGGFLATLAIPGVLVGLLAPSLRNPLLQAAIRPEASPLLLVPLLLLSCLAVGYTEELYFRVYLLRRLGQAGLSKSWAALGAILLFASAHGLQGALGLAVSGLFGAWLVWRRLGGASLHELAWGHALYNGTVMAAALYLAR